MKKTVVIVAGGIFQNREFLMQEISKIDDPFIICADGAARYVAYFDIVPDMIVGDMDSIEEEMLNDLIQRGSKVHMYREDKDESDTQLALQHAMDMEPGEIVIFGALGGRIDHSLANISLLVMAAEKDIPAKIVDESCELFLVKDSCEITGEKGSTLSLLPLSSEVTGITIRGFEFPLTDAVMRIGTPCGISNRLRETMGHISGASGYLLVIRYFKEVQ